MRKNVRAQASHDGRRSVAFISLGCPKNLVDSELMLARLAESGFSVKNSMEGADVAVVNTCSFLQSARQEAIQWINDAIQLKNNGKLGGVVVAGCLPGLRGNLLLQEFPGIDAILGPRDRLRVVKACSAALESSARKRSFLESSDSLVRAVHPRAVSTGRHSAYLKVAEGCSNRCSYCLIPDIRGEMVSRTMHSVLKEALLLAQSGVRELSLIAQDTTSYGRDFADRPVLDTLVSRLSRIEGIRWIRLLYTHPAHWTEELMETMLLERKLCKYADIPIQHVSDRMLKLMRRRISQRELVEVLEKIRTTIPGISLRTTVMVGFPGEGESEFSELIGFLKYFRFDHVGAFAYSRENGTPAASLPGQVQEDIKEDRLRRVMAAQREICSVRNSSFVGRNVTVLMDSVQPDGTRGVGRTEGQAPEVDGIVRITGHRLSEGRFFKVCITDCSEYDLFGKAMSLDEHGRG